MSCGRIGAPMAGTFGFVEDEAVARPGQPHRRAVRNRRAASMGFADDRSNGRATTSGGYELGMSVGPSPSANDPRQA